MSLTVAINIIQSSIDSARVSDKGSQISLSSTSTRNNSSLDYHLISISPPTTTIENFNKEHIHSDSDDEQRHLNQIQADSSTFPSSSQQSLVHSVSRHYMTRNTHSLASSNIDIPIRTKSSLVSTIYYCLKTNDEFSGTTRIQTILPSAKMNIKALNHSL
ncbi:unnamed protein product [Rotaria sordida]|uniref:Uncharacterized protein n=1 Tax=Rotaria sordida TaxID=392033 RepID=A0A814Z9N0_9BILA|nr:unnamed protein product [Rotaria sordida]